MAVTAEGARTALFGKWRLDPTDVAARDTFGEVALEFKRDGSLTYVIEEAAKYDVMLLRYRIEGNELITDQPSSPKEERTRYSFTDDGKLILALGGLQARYVRL
jgi:hypothetical protein